MNKFCSATLRIASKTMNAKDITIAIGVDATECHDIGEVLSLKSPRPKNRKETLWLFKSCVSEDLPLEEHIKDLLFFSETKYQELDSIASKCDIEVFCSFASTNGQGGFVLDHVLLQRLAKSKIDFVFDLYLSEE